MLRTVASGSDFSRISKLRQLPSCLGWGACLSDNIASAKDMVEDHSSKLVRQLLNILGKKGAAAGEIGQALQRPAVYLGSNSNREDCRSLSFKSFTTSSNVRTLAARYPRCSRPGRLT